MMTDGINAAHTKLGSSIPKGRPTPSAAMEVKGAMKGITAAGIRFWTLKESPFMVMDRATGALIIRVGLKATAEISNIAKRMSANCIVNFLLYSTSERQIE